MAVAATVLGVAGVTVALDGGPPADKVPAPVAEPSDGEPSAKAPTLNVGPWDHG